MGVLVEDPADTRRHDETETVAEPVWFGLPTDPIFGWLHMPANRRARGAVLLCPPIGIEFQFSQYNLRVVARRLAAAGFLALRFDYAGRGNSADGDAESISVSSWLETIQRARRLVESMGVEWIAAVGLRMGAILASRAGVGLDALVLWDPCSSGKTFLREQRVLHAVARAPRQVATTSEIPGLAVRPEVMTEIGALELPAADELPANVLVLADPARPYPAALRSRLQRAGITWADHADDSPVLDTGAVGYEMPEAIVDQVISWFTSTCGGTETLLAEAVVRTTAAVAEAGDGARVVETFVRLGPLGLFGILSEPESSSDGDDSRPVVLLLSSAANSLIGPARHWVELSRLWAARGFRTVRLDFSGVGDSPTREGQPEHAIYAAEVLQDIIDAARAVSADDPSNVILVGLCSGALAAIAAAPALRPRGVVAINPWLTYEGFKPAVSARQFEIAVARSRRARSQTEDKTRTSGGPAGRSSLGDRLPPVLWRLATQMGLGNSPERFLRPLVRAKVPTLLVCGELEAHAPMTRTPRLLRRLEAIRGAHFVCVPDLDHGLFGARDRKIVGDLATSFLDGLTSEAASLGPSSRARQRRIVRPRLQWANDQPGPP